MRIWLCAVHSFWYQSGTIDWPIEMKLDHTVDITKPDGMSWFFFFSAICWGSLFSDRNVKMDPDRGRVNLEGLNLVCVHVFSQKSKWRCLFSNSAICWSSSFCDQNEKMDTDRARVHLESSNLVCRHALSRKSK